MTIGREEAGESTWFHGYNEKFFHDRGVLYHYLYGWLEWPLALEVLYAHKGMLCTKVSLQQARQWMREGIQEARNTDHGGKAFAYGCFRENGKRKGGLSWRRAHWCISY